jgi:hypothetical protein
MFVKRHMNELLWRGCIECRNGYFYRYTQEKTSGAMSISLLGLRTTYCNADAKNPLRDAALVVIRY